MEKLTITKVSSSDKSKDGKPLINKFGKPFFKVGIQTNEYGSTWLNGLMPFSPDRWEGTTQELEVYDEEYQGKTYKKFKLPPRDKGGMSDAQYQTILAEIRAVNANVLILLGEIRDKGKTSEGDKVPDFSEAEEDPFEGIAN